MGGISDAAFPCQFCNSLLLFTSIVTCVMYATPFVLSQLACKVWLIVTDGPVWARGRCRISPPRFLAECYKRQLNKGSFVLLYFRLSTFSDLY